jgi:Domain of Unknown Function (DUF1259)
MTAKKAAPAARFGIRRAKPIKDGGMDVPTVMGLANSTNFQPTAGRARQRHRRFRTDRQEGDPVLRVLRDHGIEVTAIHNQCHEELVVKITAVRLSKRCLPIKG